MHPGSENVLIKVKLIISGIQTHPVNTTPDKITQLSGSF
jgi:hypothetical protein